MERLTLPIDKKRCMQSLHADTKTTHMSVAVDHNFIRKKTHTHMGTEIYKLSPQTTTINTLQLEKKLSSSLSDVAKNLVLRLNVFCFEPGQTGPVCFDIVSRYFVDNSSNHNYYWLWTDKKIAQFLLLRFLTASKNMDYDAVAIQICFRGNKWNTAWKRQ